MGERVGPGVAVVRGVGQRPNATGIEHDHRGAALAHRGRGRIFSDRRTGANTVGSSAANASGGASASSTTSLRSRKMWVERTIRRWPPTVSVPTSSSAGLPWKRTTLAVAILSVLSRPCAARTSARLAVRKARADAGSGSGRLYRQTATVALPDATQGTSGVGPAPARPLSGAGGGVPAGGG